MKQFLRYLYAISAAIVGVAIAALLIYNYWEKIVGAAKAGGRIASNIIGQVGSSSVSDDDVYDI